MRQTQKRKKRHIKYKKHNYKGGANNLSHNKTTKFVKSKCSPKPVGNKKSKTCYTDTHLIKFKDMWNQKNPNNQIIATDKETVWNELKNKLSNVCDRESCWYKQFVNSYDSKNELEELFAPKSPDQWKINPNQWLSTNDILKVMNQYTKIYKCFEFIGPSPIDYDFIEYPGECVSNELCNFNIQNQINKGKTKIGIIFNTDPHNKGGSHWISLFINIKKQFIFYFDSAGNPIPKSVKKFVKNVEEQGEKLNTPIKFKFDQNYPKEHQYGTTECGMYSLYFIIHMLEDKLTGEYLKTHVINDKYIEKFRKIYYNEEL
jgi:hypothetical protein